VTVSSPQECQAQRDIAAAAKPEEYLLSTVPPEWQERYFWHLEHSSPEWAMTGKAFMADNQHNNKKGI
jgi:hypothetical protein